jgi:hypothetical protein
MILSQIPTVGEAAGIMLFGLTVLVLGIGLAIFWWFFVRNSRRHRRGSDHE